MNTTVRSTAAVLLGTIVMLGCGTDAPEEPKGTARSVSLSIQTSKLPGYEHAVEQSQFNLGLAATASVEHGITKLTGDNGVFAVLPNGAALARPNANAPCLLVGAYGSTGTEHNARVLQYFTGAGLPADQVEGVYVNTLSSGVEGPVGPGNEPGVQSSQFEAWYSVIRRQLNGIPIVDSLARARFNAQDEVVSETVYWPALPSAVVADAQGLAANLAIPDAKAAYLAKLPNGGAAPGRVVVRHSSYAYRGTFVARASYDLLFRAGHASYVRHYDLTGSEFVMPEESATQP